jgi:hypothetical protein
MISTAEPTLRGSDIAIRLRSVHELFEPPGWDPLTSSPLRLRSGIDELLNELGARRLGTVTSAAIALPEPELEPRLEQQLEGRAVPAYPGWSLCCLLQPVGRRGRGRRHLHRPHRDAHAGAPLPGRRCPPGSASLAALCAGAPHARSIPPPASIPARAPQRDRALYHHGNVWAADSGTIGGSRYRSSLARPRSRS